MSEDGKSSSWKKPKNLSKEDIELTFWLLSTFRCTKKRCGKLSQILYM
jgi:hypothetical protein